jgi:serine/threonine protein kinase
MQASSRADSGGHAVFRRRGLKAMLSVGTKLGRYEIRSTLGAGGMGEVYRARDTQLGRDVAIKVLPSAFAVDQDRLRLFEHEACAASALNHPNILVVHDIAFHGAPYVVCELLEGETLRNRIGGTALGQRRAIDYASQIAHGLAAAHEKGIIHRDLKPDNIFITNDGRVKILDFGLAKLTQVDGEDEVQTDIPTRRVDTEPGVAMGTLGYISPEQLKGRAADQRSDIFAFGAVLYEMLSGRRAFRGESRAETMSAILKEDPPELSDTNKNVSSALERLVNHCLEKNPESRFQSARDLVYALEALSGSTGNLQTAARPVRSGRAKWRELIPWIGAGLFAILAAFAFLAPYLSPAQKEEAHAVRLTIPPPARGVVSTLSVSPDGRRVVYGAPNADGKQVLWLRSLDSTTAQPLPGTDNPFFTTFWSPDSRFLGFVSSTDNKLKRLDINGGAPQILANAPNGRGGTWNRDGVIVFAPAAEGPLSRVSSTGGPVTEVTALDQSHKEISHRYPWFLPDGQHFLFFARGATYEGNSVCVGSLDSKNFKRLINADSGAVYSPPGYLLYVRDGTLMAHAFDLDRLELKNEPIPIADAVIGFDLTSNLARFSVSETGVLVYYGGTEFNKADLIWVDRQGKQIGAVAKAADYGYIRLSRDNKRLITAVRDPSTRWDLWIIDLADGGQTRFTFDAANEVFPIWSHDGSRVAFSSNRSGQVNLYQKLSNGSGNEEEILVTDQPKFCNDWSSDGQFIVFHKLSGTTRADIWVLPFSGDRKPFPYLETQFGEREARFSPDGRWIAYTSDETGLRDVYVQSFPIGRGKWQISRGGGGPPKWRGDGKEIFYVSGDKLMSVEVKTDGDTLVMGTPQPLFEIRGAPLPGALGGAAFDASTDGQKFLIGISVQEATFTPITVVLNWAADLRR